MTKWLHAHTKVYTIVMAFPIQRRHRNLIYYMDMTRILSDYSTLQTVMAIRTMLHIVITVVVAVRMNYCITRS